MMVKAKLPLNMLKSRKGNATVEFMVMAVVLVLTFAMIVSAMVYVTQYYNASYICRRAVRTIEVSGEYNESTIHTLARDLGGDAIEDLKISVSAHYYRGKRIQLRDEFLVKLEGKYKIPILTFKDTPVDISLPIKVSLSGRSEVYWK